MVAFVLNLSPAARDSTGTGELESLHRVLFVKEWSGLPASNFPYSFIHRRTVNQERKGTMKARSPEREKPKNSNYGVRQARLSSGLRRKNGRLF